MILGEADLDGPLVAGRGAGQLLVEPSISSPPELQSVKSRASPPSNGSPSIVPAKSISTRSPSAAGGRPVRLAEALAQALELGGDRRRGSRLGAPDLEPSYSPSFAAGARRSRSGSSASPSAAEPVTSSFGIAHRRHPGVEQRPLVPLRQRVADAPAPAPPRGPTRWITSCGGTLPLRNPGIRMSPAICLAARSTAGRAARARRPPRRGRASPAAR